MGLRMIANFHSWELIEPCLLQLADLSKESHGVVDRVVLECDRSEFEFLLGQLTTRGQFLNFVSFT